MPTPEEILAGLGTITNDWRLLSAIWHLYFAAFILVLASGARPSRRVTAALLALPLISVSILAWAYGNPFNGTSFAVAAVALLAVSSHLPRERVRVAPAWLVIPGGLMIAFGWVYPHFLDDPHPIEYLYAAPTGLIPCPTLSVVIGCTIVMSGLGSRIWCLVLTIMGLFYGVFGAIRLEVSIDWVLVGGALLTACLAFQAPKLNDGPGARPG